MPFTSTIAPDCAQHSSTNKPCKIPRRVSDPDSSTIKYIWDVNGRHLCALGSTDERALVHPLRTLLTLSLILFHCIATQIRLATY
ncbi:hypothetical protein TNIN_438511 [Trichonephila inaurata madagascariensis]|uniref:Uncharacterized protein n=1 Tax=Trichonephila inaurata madagascariensis TaxID=2747483 RepID=A0A8X6XYB6_9ARAC|nr:hypothetical protein TNIN_438511 [Trichonephila inaurata madagascariensis]